MAHHCPKRMFLINSNMLSMQDLAPRSTAYSVGNWLKGENLRLKYVSKKDEIKKQDSAKIFFFRNSRALQNYSVMFRPIPLLSTVQWPQFSILQKLSMGRISKNSAMTVFYLIF